MCFILGFSSLFKNQRTSKMSHLVPIVNIPPVFCASAQDVSCSGDGGQRSAAELQSSTLLQAEWTCLRGREDVRFAPSWNPFLLWELAQHRHSGDSGQDRLPSRRHRPARWVSWPPGRKLFLLPLLIRLLPPSPPVHRIWTFEGSRGPGASGPTGPCWFPEGGVWAAEPEPGGGGQPVPQWDVLAALPLRAPGSDARLRPCSSHLHWEVPSRAVPQRKGRSEETLNSFAVKLVAAPHWPSLKDLRKRHLLAFHPPPGS